ncbi:MAG: HEAT repeat domain-containing protein [Desulfobacteraceae bacterium]|nr:HEAT repeat domain-containing protein [Desulfobacteraceae bacterium]
MKKLIKEFDVDKFIRTVPQTVSKIIKTYQKFSDWIVSSVVIPIRVGNLMTDIMLYGRVNNSHKKLVKIGPKAVERILPELKHENWTVREIIVEVLGDIGNSATKKALLFDALRDNNENVRNKTFEMLEKADIRKPEKLLIDAVKDKNEPNRWKAAEILGKQGVREAAEPLINALKDKDARVRSSAAEALGNIGSREAGITLIELLEDEDRDVRSMAAEALGNIGCSEAGPPLINALKAREEQVRSKAAEALGKIGFQEAGKLLTDTLQDENEDVRASAAEALGNIGFQEAGQTLINITGDTSTHVRRNTVQALKKLGITEAIPPLVNALDDRDYYVRIIAALSLGDMGDPVAVIPLVKALKDIDPYVRASAASALGIIGDASGLQQLAFLKSKYGSALINTAETLEKAAGAMEKTVTALEKKFNPEFMRFLDESFFLTSDIFKDVVLSKEDNSTVKPISEIMDENKYVRQCAGEAFDKIIIANNPFMESYPDLLCSACFLRSAKTTSNEYSFVACRHCGRSSYLIKNVRQAVGLIGGNIDEYQVKDDKVYINLWSEDRKTARNADIDTLEIRDSENTSYDYAINAVLITLKNDVSRSAEYIKGVPVVIHEKPPIPTGAMKMLEHEFKEIQTA